MYNCLPEFLKLKIGVIFEIQEIVEQTERQMDNI